MEEAARAALDGATEGILVADARGVAVYVNPAFARLRGVAAGALVGRPWDGGLLGGRVHGRRADGTPFTTERRVVPLPDGAGHVLFERDVTREVELAAALRQSRKMEAVGNLAGGVAHDFNNLLTAILGYGNLLRRTLPAGGEARELAAQIEASAQRAGELTRQLLGLARRGQDRDVPVDLHVVVRSLARLLTATVEKTIAIRQRLEAGSALVRGDPAQLEQALLHLALNARDAMVREGGGDLTLSTELRPGDEAAGRPGPCVVVVVADTGPGIPPETAGRVFEPGFTTKPVGEASGMGLTEADAIVKAHGGRIEVESAPGAGTRVAVRLPLALPEDAEEPEEPEELVRGAGRVLVVDDEEVVRQAAAVLLRHVGYEVTTAGDGAEALARYREAPGAFDLVLLDLVMPRMGGRECLRALREVDPRVRALLTTGYGRQDAEKVALDEGILGFVEKPYVAAQLARAVAAALARPPAEAEAAPG